MLPYAHPAVIIYGNIFYANVPPVGPPLVSQFSPLKKGCLGPGGGDGETIIISIIMISIIIIIIIIIIIQIAIINRSKPINVHMHRRPRRC